MTTVMGTFQEAGIEVTECAEGLRVQFPRRVAGGATVTVSAEEAYQWALDVVNCAPWQCWMPSEVAAGEAAWAFWQRRP